MSAQVKGRKISIVHFSLHLTFTLCTVYAISSIRNCIFTKRQDLAVLVVPAIAACSNNYCKYRRPLLVRHYTNLHSLAMDTLPISCEDPGDHCTHLRSPTVETDTRDSETSQSDPPWSQLILMELRLSVTSVIQCNDIHMRSFTDAMTKYSELVTLPPPHTS